MLITATLIKQLKIKPKIIPPFGDLRSFKPSQRPRIVDPVAANFIVGPRGVKERGEKEPTRRSMSQYVIEETAPASGPIKRRAKTTGISARSNLR